MDGAKLRFLSRPKNPQMMKTPRSGRTGHLLNDGGGLVAGRRGGYQEMLADCELFANADYMEQIPVERHTTRHCRARPPD